MVTSNGNRLFGAECKATDSYLPAMVTACLILDTRRLIVTYQQWWVGDRLFGAEYKETDGYQQW